MFYFVFLLSLFHLENRVCFISWFAGDRCGITCNDEDRDRSRRPDVEDQGWSHRSGTRWPGGREVG
jgi:hypothetical protein